MTMKVYRWPLAADYVESLPPEKQARVTQTIDQLARDFPERADVVEVDGSDNVLVARLSKDESESEELLVIEVKPEARERVLKTAPRRVHPRTRQLTRERAARIVEAGIGKGSNSLSGAEYVDSVRDIWKGLVPRADRTS